MESAKPAKSVARWLCGRPWRVVRLCERQYRPVHSSDILCRAITPVQHVRVRACHDLLAVSVFYVDYVDKSSRRKTAVTKQAKPRLTAFETTPTGAWRTNYRR